MVKTIELGKWIWERAIPEGGCGICKSGWLMFRDGLEIICPYCWIRKRKRENKK